MKMQYIRRKDKSILFVHMDTQPKKMNYTGQIYCTIEQIKQGQVAAQYS